MHNKRFSLSESSFPVSYRADICSQFFTNFIQGESFSFIGIRDNCKVNILRFISFRKEVQRKYLGSKAKNFLFVFVDLNELSGRTLVNLYHLIGLCLVETMQKEGFNVHCLNNLFIDDPSVLLKSLKEDLEDIIRTSHKTIVFLFNNFDLVKDLHLKTICQNFIALSHSNQPHVLFVFSGTRPFDSEFFFFRKIIFMTPFVKQEALDVVERNMKRYGVKITEARKKEIVSLTGGHAGLIKFVIQDLAFKHSSRLSIGELYANSDIGFQCNRILSPLTEVEKTKLKYKEPDTLLVNLHILIQSANTCNIFSPLLEHYLYDQKNYLRPFCFDKENDELYFLGKPISSSLSFKESLLMKLFLEKPEKIISRDEIMKSVWGEDEFPSDWALDKLISRLRMKLKDNPINSKYFKRIPGKGYILE